jgi:hypothetical protein
MEYNTLMGVECVAVKKGQINAFLDELTAFAWVKGAFKFILVRSIAPFKPLYAFQHPA